MEPEGDDLESSEENLYFLAIEKVFIAERGAPLYLSPKDWQVALKWYEEGIPLEWVERTLRQIFQKRRAKGTVEKVVSLGYCKRSVEAAWRRLQKMRAPLVEPDPEIDVAGRLAALAQALPSRLASRESWAERLTALEGEPEQVETDLKNLDREIFEAAEASLDDSRRQELDQRLEKALANLARRLPSQELAGARSQLYERLLRESLELPILSLFAPEATA